jgi:predicted DNA-binding protein (UPF0251 family)
MPRPCKRRRICAMPTACRLTPYPSAPLPPIFMGLDEYETIRLIDKEGLSQEACARQMGVARTTVQAIYTSARTKLAQCMIDGRNLMIQGGDYELCSGPCGGCGAHGCHSRACPQKTFRQEFPTQTPSPDSETV